MYSGGFYPFPSPEEYWAWWSRHIYYNRYDVTPGKPYADLLELVMDKNYFVLTTNVDHQFQLAGFNKARLFYTQGDYGLWQCSEPCHQATYDNEAVVRRMIAEQADMRVPSELIPRCPHCGAEMFPWVRGYGNFLQGKKYEEEYEKISKYIQKNKDRKILLIELGVGRMTPMFIQEPFWELTNSLKDAYYISVNSEYQFLPEFIEDKGIAILGDIGTVLKDLWKAKKRILVSKSMN